MNEYRDAAKTLNFGTPSIDWSLVILLIRAQNVGVLPEMVQIVSYVQKDIRRENDAHA